MKIDDPVLERELEAASNTLVLHPVMAARSEEYCVGLSHVAPPERTCMIWVDAVRGPEDRLQAWRSRRDDLPGRCAFVSLGGRLRFGGPRGPIAPGASDHVVSVETIGDPGNLTRLGVVLSRYLTEWAGDGHRIGLCFDTVTPLLQYVDFQQFFRFVHQLTRLVRRVDGVAHYHMDPTVHDEAEIAALRTLFDGALELVDGEMRVHGSDHG